MDGEALNQLVEEAKRGDPEAFGRIFDAFHGQIYRFIASRVRRPSDAEDLTQLVFVKALESLPRYQARGVPFGGWLFRLARNTTIDHIRTRREHEELGEESDLRTDDASPETLAILRTDLDAMSDALRQLTPDQREVIALRFFAGRSSRETADLMGRQEGTIRGLQFRAIAALRHAIGVKIGDDEPTE
jgi:RNA polymerase sigma-70 factor (ECF subfamily)